VTPYLAPSSLHLRELPPKRVDNEPARRWFWSARCDLIVWLSGNGALLGFQFCYDKEDLERALTWMSGRGFSHMRVDTGPTKRDAPLLVADGPIDAARILNLFLQDCALVPGDYVEAVRGKLLELAALAE